MDVLKEIVMQKYRVMNNNGYDYGEFLANSEREAMLNVAILVCGYEFDEAVIYVDNNFFYTELVA